MDEWVQICEDMSRKLDRELQQEEIEFIKWVYEKLRKEQIENQPGNSSLTNYDAI